MAQARDDLGRFLQPPLNLPRHIGPVEFDTVGAMVAVRCPRDLVNGINNGGKIVGVYVDAAGREHGFDEFGSSHSGVPSFITFDVPGASATAIFGVNSLGLVAGSFLDSAGATHGFVNTRITDVTIDVPGASSTEALGINDKGH